MAPLNRSSPQGPTVSPASLAGQHSEVRRRQPRCTVGVAHDLHRTERTDDSVLVDGDEHRPYAAAGHPAVKQRETLILQGADEAGERCIDGACAFVQPVNRLGHSRALFRAELLELDTGDSRGGRRRILTPDEPDDGGGGRAMTQAEPGSQLPGALMVVRRPAVDVDGHGAGAAAGEDRKPCLLPAVNDVVNQNAVGLGLEPSPILVVSQERVRAGNANHVREQAQAERIRVDRTDGRHERNRDQRSEPGPPELHDRQATQGAGCA